MRHQYRTTALLLALSYVLAQLPFLLLPGVFESWNAQVFDQLFTFRAHSPRFQPPYDDRIVHVDINNVSLKQIGRFYLDRSYYARGVQNLGRMGVAAQAYDFVFAAPQSESEDEALIQAAAGASRAYFGVAFRLSGQPDPSPGNEPAVEAYLKKTLWRIRVAGDASSPGLSFGIAPLSTFPALADASRGLGSLSIDPDADGVIRRMPLLVRYGGEFYPSLPLRVMCDYLQVPPDHVVLRPGRSITLLRAPAPDIVIPIDARGNFRINFIGAWDRMKHFNFSDVYKASEDRDEMDLFRQDLAGRIAVVADVSANSRDVGSVPTDREFPLSGLLANVMHNILTGSFLHELTFGESLLADLALLAAVYVFALRFRPALFAASVLLLTTMYVAVATGSFLYRQMMFPIVQPLLMLAFGVTFNVGYRFLVEEQDKAFVRRTFEAYFPSKVVKRIMANPQLIAGAGERKELTILFSDIAGFTKRSSTLPPDRIQAFLNEYFEAMIDIVFRYEGTVDKFMGDGLMVFCGDPEPQPDHAVRCVKMAIDMQRRIGELSGEWQDKGEAPLSVRIGINTGVVVVGNMGSTRRLSYTVLGADVNLAQRFESNAPVGGILISARTNELLNGTIPTRSAGKIHVKGYEDAIEAYVVIT